MAQTTKKFQMIQKVDADNTLLIHPETEAEVVTYAPGSTGLTSTNVGAAIGELQQEIKDITGGGVVTGVKGSEESAYRVGNVSLSAANVGAESAGAVSTHNSDGTAHSDIRTSVTTAQTKADQAYALAQGMSKASSFATLAAAKTALTAAEKTDYKVGDHIYIVATGTPDYWVSAVNDTKSGDFGYFTLSELEGAKVDLTDYQKKQLTTAITVDGTSQTTVEGALGAINTLAAGVKTTATGNATEITNIKNGTTKVGAATAADSAAKWTTARDLGVSVNSGKKTDGSTDITGSGSESVDGSANKTISVTLGDSGVTAGSYSAVNVNAKGIVTQGGQVIEVGASGQTTPSATLATGGIFFKAI